MPSKGTSKQRGYDSHHKLLRKRYEPIVKAGRAKCWRCGEPIAADQPWDLGHDDYDRTKYNGPEHTACNRATANRQQPTDTSRAW